MAAPKVSVVIPVYNEEAVLPALFARLYPALDALGESYEVIFVNDGSSDRSAALLRGQFELRPDVTRVILFNGNFGQHLAIMAGFEASRGERVVTLDADLQNPPEEIAKLLAKMDEGYDYVGTVRSKRQDSAFRRNASRIMNAVRERITRIRMTDQGCMLRAYSRDDVAAVCAQHAPLVGHADAGDALADGVHDPRRVAPERAVLSLAAHGPDVVVAFVHLGEELRDFLRWVL